jgi:Flp pilus assembly protein TadG
MMPRPRQLWPRFANSTRGIAAVEFAMVLPVLAVIFLASIDGGRAIAIYMKVRAATYTIAAITNQYSIIHDADAQGNLGVTSKVLAPYSTATGTLAITISQIAIDINGNATIVWSDTQGGTARAQGAPMTVPTSLKVPGSFLVFGEVNYNYQPLFGYFGNNTTINLSDNLYTTPRISPSITRVSP